MSAARAKCWEIRAAVPVPAVMSMLTVTIIAQTSSPRDCHMIVITQGIGMLTFTLTQLWLMHFTPGMCCAMWSFTCFNVGDRHAFCCMLAHSLHGHGRTIRQTHEHVLQPAQVFRRTQHLSIVDVKPMTRHDQSKALSRDNVPRVINSMDAACLVPQPKLA